MINYKSLIAKDKIACLYEQESLFNAIKYLDSCSPIVNEQEIFDLKNSLSKTNKPLSKFILHIGDCSEKLEFNPSRIDKIVNDLTNQSKIIKTNPIDVIKIIRGGGQFFKPRTNFFEQNKNNQKIYNYFGEGINSLEIREPDLSRLYKAYDVSFAFMNYLRQKQENIYISHEALFLPYELGLIRQGELGFFSSSAHMLWLGYRNLDLSSPQVEFLSLINNPIGIKIGPESKLDELIKIIMKLNPKNSPGKIILIFRFGNNIIKEKMPKFLMELENLNLNLIYLLDPMHGNNNANGNKKFRLMQEIIAEVLKFMDIINSSFFGLSLEYTPDDFYECLNHEKDLANQRFDSLCDPRLNKSQLGQIINKISKKL